MKNKLIYFILIIQFLGLTNSISQNCYELVWSDEFNYSGLPDSTNWSYEVGNNGWGNNELQYYTEKRLENARVEDSVLVIEARKETYNSAAYTSARLITYTNKLSWKYGKIEARIKMPYGQGIWPAFWMLGNSIFENTSWPACGEIDILEMIGGGADRDNVAHGTAHWADASNNHASYGGTYSLASGILADTFHVYAIEWNSTSIKWFFNGIKYHEIDITPAQLNEFHNNFFIIINLAVGGNWPGYPNSSTIFPQQLLVDYIRVYQLNGIPEIKGKKNLIKKESNLSFSTVESPDFKYTWTVPSDANIIDGQGSSKIIVDWGCNPGNVSCNLQTLCDTHSLVLPVKIDSLSITGKEMVLTKEKNIIYKTPYAFETNYNWTFPDSVTINGSADTNIVSVNWGTEDGIIKLITQNSCSIDSTEIRVIINKQLPYPDILKPHTVPGTIEATDYDYGGEGISYHDTESQNLGTGSRQDEGVDTEVNDGGENIGWIEPNEWVEYTINVTKSGVYNIELRVASQDGGGELDMLFNGESRTGNIIIPRTGSWTSFMSVYIEGININENDTLLRIKFNKGLFNLSRIIISTPATSLEEKMLNQSIYLYPSVTSGIIYINNNIEGINYIIINSAGQIITQKNNHKNNHINVSSLPDGIYSIHLYNKSTLIKEKFIKIKQ